MKKILLSALAAAALLMTGCHSLDLNPLSQGSSENWYSTEEEFVMALNDLYRPALWYWEANRLYHADRFSDDWNQREQQYDWIVGGVSSDTGYVETMWLNTYMGVTRANTILSSVRELRGSGRVSEDLLDRYESEASFFRACFYSYLVFLYGDVPFYTEYIPMETAYSIGRTDKEVILEHIYADFDTAARSLPESYGETQRATRGAALAFKARTASWMLDWETAAEAAKACMDLGVYSLHPDFGELFLTDTRTSSELIFTLPRSKELLDDGLAANSFYTRNVGGTSTAQPSWELLCSFLCTDGLPIDESPLYDPTDPFANRDPRCAETMVAFGSEFLGFIYDPGAREVMNLSTGKMVSNQDSQLVTQHSAWNGMCLRKGVDSEWTEDKETDASVKLMRYADVLLIYAEAKTELDEIDASVLDALNRLRARAYRVDVADKEHYPAVTETDRAKLRTLVRMERRMELAWENRRWFDLIRWRLAETAITRPQYVLPQADGLAVNIAAGDYFFPADRKYLPRIDENGLVDLSPVYESGKYRVAVQRSFVNRQYLLPIPAKDVMTSGLTQNDDY